MAVGDDAVKAKWALVPDTGEEGRVRWGAREINRTRDYAAQVLAKIPTTKGAYRTAAGITSSTGAPQANQGAPGDIHFQILSNT